MTYTKPEVVLVGSSLAAIQAHQVKTYITLDAATSGPNQGQFNSTASAYEADE